MESSSGRPVLFLDVDGTLLPFGPGRASPVGEPGALLDRLDCRLGRRLTSLSAGLVWATTWEDEANTELAARLGLPPLPVVRWPESSPETEREDRWFGVHWKTRTLVGWAHGRPFVWVDDEIADGDREWVLARHSGPALLHRVEPNRGLEERDFAVIREWLRALSS
ncbi:HAD domain-containing protein [Amycolatopsis orientalis]|uniref:HAD domain-containing protein n=1 Tax=Amycolatopsis orientalis TaxID=31958 RepID=UPI0003A0CE67|nr:HAD domain-containing protein [Amycolatopsis orientalis]